MPTDPSRRRSTTARRRPTIAADPWRPFAAARSFVRALELTNKRVWKKFCSSDARPNDIPTNPDWTYRTEWHGWGDWLGTDYIAHVNRSYRPFAEARTFVHTLQLKDSMEWGAYARSGGEKPADIPSRPDHTYQPEWRGFGDWLGTGAIARANRTFRPFAAARAFVQALDLKNKKEWQTYCRSSARPVDIPTRPDKTYPAEWHSLGDWLGTDTVAHVNRSYRPFAEARTFVHTLQLKDSMEWGAYARSGGEKPADIPSRPDHTYRAEWLGFGDWLGTGAIADVNRTFQPFTAARAFIRALGLKNKKAWQGYCSSSARPDDIPTRPEKTYPDEWRGLGDWLGTINKWTKPALLAFLHDLRPFLPSLDERELYAILQQGGQLRTLRAALSGASPLVVLRDLKETGGNSLEAALVRIADEEIQARAAEYETADDIDAQGDLSVAADSILAHTEPDSSSASSVAGGAGDELPALANLVAGLRGIDELAALHYGLDDEAAEFLITYRVGLLWQRYMKNRAEVRALLAEQKGGPWLAKLKAHFLAEADGAENLEIPDGWSFAIHGVPCPPNLMQRRVAWAVRERRRVGNWSGVGSGKTLSAVLASRVVDARATLIVTNNATAQQWKDQIRLAYPDSLVHLRVDRALHLNRRRHNCVVLNYEKFQLASGAALIRQLLSLDLDFVVLDEVHFVKQRDEHASNRRKVMEALITNAAERNPNLCVLGMSATPVINNLLEARKLLEITIGTDFSDLDTQPTINNALAIHQKLMLHGFRYRPPYEQEMHVRDVPVVRNDLLPKLRTLGRNVLAVEQLLLPAKLDAVKTHLQPGTLAYTHYVDGMLAPARRFIERQGLSVGLYTGGDKSGLSGFMSGQVKVLLASSPVGTGLDGLQTVCNRLVMLCLPWTNAGYEQIIGRIRRQGGVFGEVEIIIPQVLLEHEGDTWSWDRGRLACIHYKRTLSDCALDGTIPETVRISPNTLLDESREALDRWIARVAEHGVLAIDRQRLTVPLPPDLRQAAVRAHGEFSELNRRWSVSRGATTNDRLQLDPSEWYLYHTLYREARSTWPEIPAERIAERIRPRPEWVVGDFGCGECLLKQALPNAVTSLDHIAWNADVISCDMAATPLADQSLDCAVFSLSLMGLNWVDYLREAHRTLKPFGYLFVAEPLAKWRDRVAELQAAIQAAGFQLVGDAEQRYDFLYLTAFRN